MNLIIWFKTKMILALTLQCIFLLVSNVLTQTKSKFKSVVKTYQSLEDYFIMSNLVSYLLSLRHFTNSYLQRRHQVLMLIKN